MISIFPLLSRLLLFEVKPPTWGYQWIFPCKWKLKGPHRCSGRPPEGCVHFPILFLLLKKKKVAGRLKRGHLARCWNSRRCSLIGPAATQLDRNPKKFVREQRSGRVRRQSDVPTSSHLSTCLLPSEMILLTQTT